MIDREQAIKELEGYMGEGSIPPRLARLYAGQCADAILALPDPVHEAAREVVNTFFADCDDPADAQPTTDDERFDAVDRLRAALSDERVLDDPEAEWWRKRALSAERVPDEDDDEPRWLKLNPESYQGGGVMGRRADRVPTPITDGQVEAMARVIWEWRAKFEPFLACAPVGYPYERLIEPTKDDLRELARRFDAALNGGER